MASITIERLIDAPLEKVWSAASDFGQSPGPGISIVVEKQGNPKDFGVGTERTITIGSGRARERLESVVPQSCFTYSMLSGAPVKNYLGRAEFTPCGNATRVKWTATFTPKIPGTGWLVGKVISGVINKLLDALA